MANRKRPAAKRVTIFDVARAAGVSHATVSRVLNQSAYVDPEKQQRVIQAMGQLGFSVNQRARSLASNRSQLVGFITSGYRFEPPKEAFLTTVEPDTSNDYGRRVLSGIQSELSSAHYSLILYWTIYQKTRESAYVASLVRGLADGFLLLLPDNAQLYVEALRREGAPFVLIDHQIIDDHGPAVRATNRKGAFDATRHLIELGHRRIACIMGHSDWGCSLERLAGYQEALAEAGIAVDPTLIYKGNFTEESGRLAARHLLALPNPPSAIFASNDGEALGVLEVAEERSLRIPDDLSLVGFDDDPLAARHHLTTVRQPLEAMGKTAARMLLEAIEEPDRLPTVVELPTELIMRGTTALCRT